MWRSLSALLQASAPLPEAQLCHIATQLCSALSAAHEKNIIHRDLKPDNIFICPRGAEKDFVKLLDFGIAKLSDPEGFELATANGVVLGTPTHMAPEQALGKELTPAIDIYALGVILYQMATGLLPFFDPNRLTLAMMHARDLPPNPREKNPALSEALTAVILRCLEKDKARRYPSMQALSDALPKAAPIVTPKPEATLAPEPAPPNPAKITGYLPWVIVGALLAVLVVFWVQQSALPRGLDDTPRPLAAPQENQPRPAITPVVTPTQEIIQPTTPMSKEKPTLTEAPQKKPTLIGAPKEKPEPTEEPIKKKPGPAGTMTIDPF